MQLNEGLEVLGTDDYLNGRELCGVFEGSALERVILPSTLKRIEYDAFWCCKNLKGISFPENLEFIGRYCFYQSALESIEFPSTLKVIERSAFLKCEKLRNVEFPTSLRTISQGAFAYCTNLATVKFSDGLEILGTDVNERRPGVFEGSAAKNV